MGVGLLKPLKQAVIFGGSTGSCANELNGTILLLSSPSIEIGSSSATFSSTFLITGTGSSVSTFLRLFFLVCFCDFLTRFLEDFWASVFFFLFFLVLSFLDIFLDSKLEADRFFGFDASREGAIRKGRKEEKQKRGRSKTKKKLWWRHRTPRKYAGIEAGISEGCRRTKPKIRSENGSSSRNWVWRAMECWKLGAAEKNWESSSFLKLEGRKLQDRVRTTTQTDKQEVVILLFPLRDHRPAFTPTGCSLFLFYDMVLPLSLLFLLFLLCLFEVLTSKSYYRSSSPFLFPSPPPPLHGTVFPHPILTRSPTVASSGCVSVWVCFHFVFVCVWLFFFFFFCASHQQ